MSEHMCFAVGYLDRFGNTNSPERIVNHLKWYQALGVVYQAFGWKNKRSVFCSV